MSKVLIAVNGIADTKRILSSMNSIIALPESIILLHVQQLVGNSMMTSMMSDSEIETLKESIEGTEHQEKLDRKSEKVLTHYKEELEKNHFANIKSVVKAGHPSDEILKVADEENVNLIIMGCSGKSRFQRLASGCASKDVMNNARVSVHITKNNGCGEHAHMWIGEKAYAL